MCWGRTFWRHLLHVRIKALGAWAKKTSWQHWGSHSTRVEKPSENINKRKLTIYTLIKIGWGSNGKGKKKATKGGTESPIADEEIIRAEAPMVERQNPAVANGSGGHISKKEQDNWLGRSPSTSWPRKKSQNQKLRIQNCRSTVELNH